MAKFHKFITAAAFFAAMQLAVAAESPQEQRHELMEDVREHAKTIGRMLEGESAFDADAAMGAMQAWSEAAEVFGGMFPEGTESGYDTRATAAVWTDRAGFDAALNSWAEAVGAAIAANPQDLESLQAAAGPVFKKCKACHEDYRLEEDN
jgi:cytochrome c556